MIQSQVGAAEMKWRSGRYGLHGAVREVWDRVSATGRFEIADRVALRGAATHAIHLAKEAVDIAYEACGSDAIFEHHPIQQRFQDIHTITQHLQGPARPLRDDRPACPRPRAGPAMVVAGGGGGRRRGPRRLRSSAPLN